MPSLTSTPSWQRLSRHREQLAALNLREEFARDPERFQRLSLEACGLLLDYSKNLIVEETVQRLLELAEVGRLRERIEAMFAGEKINTTENRAVLHTALRNRSSQPVYLNGSDVMSEVRRVLQRLRMFCHEVHDARACGHSGKRFTDIVNLGIGGSDLGPQMVCEALEPYATHGLRAHFVSNVDGAHLGRTLKQLTPDTTLFIVASKTFTTQETLANARSARSWLIDRLGSEAAVASHFAAVSTNLEATTRFGIRTERVFEFWDWVGGRYSLWSAIGLPIALYVGWDNFERLLEGAHAMDVHFRHASFARNMPVLLALLGVWYIDFWDADNYVVLPYDQSLHRFPAFLQQLDMESNGKRIDLAGASTDCATGPVIWGEPGTNGQHAFFQHLHQGTRWTPADFIVPARTHYPMGEHHLMLLANCFAQTQALMRGKTADEAVAELKAQGMSEQHLARLTPHKVFPGNRPSNTLVLEQITPTGLGALIALYEHKVFVQGVIWNINSFDQWGVELGKQLAGRVLADLQCGQTSATADPSTAGLMARIRCWGG